MYNLIESQDKGANGVSYCPRCGAYIPIGESACPACGYDPEAEKKAREEAAREEAQKKARREAEEKARREREAKEKAQRAAEEAKKKSSSGSSSAQQSYTAQNKKQGEWVPPWSQTQSSHVGQSSGYYDARSDAYRKAASDSVSHQRLSVLSYFGFLFVIPYLKRRGDPFARFHASQGLTLFLLEAALSCCSGIFGGFISLAGSLFVIYCAIRGIRSVLAGRMDKLPIIGDIDLLK